MKRLNEPYVSGERAWVKVKNRGYSRYELDAKARSAGRGTATG